MTLKNFKPRSSEKYGGCGFRPECRNCTQAAHRLYKKTIKGKASEARYRRTEKRRAMAAALVVLATAGALAERAMVGPVEMVANEDPRKKEERAYPSSRPHWYRKGSSRSRCPHSQETACSVSQGL
jgi:hypothetical protein